MMKYKTLKILCAATLFVSFSSVSNAGNLYDTRNNNSYGNNTTGDSQYKYESNTGTKYKYDLNNPSDRIMYGVDPAAKIRDSVNPMVDIDRGMGQYGGGSQ